MASFHFPEKVPFLDASGQIDKQWLDFLRALNTLLPFTHIVGEISLAQLVAHASTHKSAGGDSIRLDELAAATDNTTLDASTSAHGLLPKLSGNAAHRLNGLGQWV